MNIDKLIDELSKKGIINKENLTHKPREGAYIKKMKFWFNPTAISKRWDGEIWYIDNSHERLAKMSLDSRVLFMYYTDIRSKGQSI